MVTQSMMSRRDLLRGGLAVGAAGLAGRTGFADVDQAAPVLHERPTKEDRRFRSPAIEDTVAQVKALIADAQLGIMFENCFPNTLDTTVSPATFGGKPDTFVITGDIDAMWLRDSSAQVWPYLPLAAKDPALQSLPEGVIRAPG